MTAIEILAKQTEDAYFWTNKLISSIPHDKWDRIPVTMETNVTWQAGHLIMSFYYHSIMVIAGHQMDILQKIPLKEYGKLFTDAAPENSLGKINPKELQKQLMLMEQKSIDVIRALSEKDLENKLEPSEIPHPIAKNKFDALDWNIKHTMWHCGQIGILKRIVDERYDFGLRKTR
jgi:hypothetical protein